MLRLLALTLCSCLTLNAAEGELSHLTAPSRVSLGKSSPKDAEGNALFEDVWRYLSTHPVDQVGEPTPADPKVRINLR